jgi:hypothetical protein
MRAVQTLREESLDMRADEAGTLIAEQRLDLTIGHHDPATVVADHDRLWGVVYNPRDAEIRYLRGCYPWHLLERHTSS